MADDPPSVSRALPGADPTPEKDEILHDRGIEPLGGMTSSRRNTALIVAGTAMVLGILWVNSGNGGQTARRDLTAPTGAARERADIVARETVDYAAVAPRPRPLGSPGTDPHSPVLNPEPGAAAEGQIVPAIQPGAAPGGTGQAQPTLAEQARRSTLIAYGGRELGGDAPQGSGPPAAGAAASEPTAIPGKGEGAAPNALDLLRQSSAVGEARASLLPNRNFLITAGTLIPCTLQTAINSAQPGYTSCLIPRDVYSENGRVVLMEKGTRVLGEYRGGIQQGQNRLFVLWTRAVTPQGVRIDLASPGSDALGRAGLAGAVDSFFWARFGGALLLSLVDDAAYIAGQSVSSGNGNFNNVTRAPSEGAAIALQNNISIRPVLKKNQGEEVGIFVAKDFNFADVYNLELRR